MSLVRTTSLAVRAKETKAFSPPPRSILTETSASAPLQQGATLTRLKTLRDHTLFRGFQGLPACRFPNFSGGLGPNRPFHQDLPTSKFSGTFPHISKPFSGPRSPGTPPPLHPFKPDSFIDPPSPCDSELSSLLNEEGVWTWMGRFPSGAHPYLWFQTTATLVTCAHPVDFHHGEGAGPWGCGLLLGPPLHPTLWIRPLRISEQGNSCTRCDSPGRLISTEGQVASRSRAPCDGTAALTVSEPSASLIQGSQVRGRLQTRGTGPR